MIKEPTDQGLNRTGIGTSPIDSQALLDASRVFPPSSPGNDQLLCDVRTDYIREAEPIGTMPPPSTLKGAASTILKKFQGEKITVFLDKLGERLAFERTGSRLYQALICKVRASDENTIGPTLPELEKIYQDETRHMLILKDALQFLGADPTVMTPSANVTAVASMGLVQVLCDPRTTVSESLCAILMAELADNDGWELLIQLAQQMEQNDLVDSFTEALQEEQQHLSQVRAWVGGFSMVEAGAKTPEPIQVPTPRKKTGNVPKAPGPRRSPK